MKPLVAGALALRDGVIFAKPGGFIQVIMELDCLDVVDQWVAHQDSRFIVAPILVSFEELASSLNKFDIQHVKRHDNCSAHLCAISLLAPDGLSSQRFVKTSIQADYAGFEVHEKSSKHFP